MKSTFYFAIFSSILVVLISCQKWLPQNKIVGSWNLEKAEKRRFLNSDRIFTGYESGIFVFNDDGTASYLDTAIQMNGSWDMRRILGGYADSDGNWHDESRTALIIHLYNFNANRILDWYFDNIDFRISGDRFIAFMDPPGYNYKYDFRKQ
jgi:hypothetical protein